MSYQIALIFTENSASERDLGKMIAHLDSELSGIPGVEVSQLVLDPSKVFIPLTNYDHLVFCGYDHLTLASLHYTMEVAPKEIRLVMYDEPGAAIDRELNILFFRGIDMGRMPGSSSTRIIYSWSYKDIVSISRQDMLLSSNGSGVSGTVKGSSKSKSPSRSGSRNTRARQVEDKREAQAREGNETAGDTGEEKAST